MNFSPVARDLLIALRAGKHIKGNPTHARELVVHEWTEVDAAVSRLRERELIKKTTDPDKPGSPFIRLTPRGMEQADRLLEAQRKPTLRERIASIPLGRGIWDLVKIGLGFVLGLLAHDMTGNL